MVLKAYCPFYTSTLTHLINLSFASHFIPPQWKIAIIRPVAKTKSPIQNADFRPISILPVLSRIVEKQIVHRFIYPTLIKPPLEPLITDQFAFRPTDSTSAAIISILHTQLLKTYEYVSIISLDFSKAFDTVKHSSLFDKISTLDIPDEIHNWLVEYHLDRSHLTIFKGLSSTQLPINASIVQGSGLGPTNFSITASDLHPSQAQNLMVKFADDTYLLTGSSQVHSIQTELTLISSWASDNNLTLNNSKSKQMIISRPRNTHSAPPTIPNITRVNSLKILGVILQDNLKLSAHIDHLAASCASSFYAVRKLKAHGFSPSSIHHITKATIVSKLLYASPSWWGLTQASDKDRLERILKRAKRLDYIEKSFPSVQELANTADSKLLLSTLHNTKHVLYQLLPPLRPPSTLQLRPRAHNHTLPPKNNKHFISRMLYKDSY